MGRVPGVVGDLADVEALREFQDVRLDLAEIDDVTRCQDEPLLHRPATVGGVARFIDRRLG